MDFKDIQRLVRLITREKLSEFKMKDGDFEINIRTEKYSKPPKSQIITPIASSIQEITRTVESNPSPKTDEPIAETESNNGLLEIKSPIVGTFYRSTSPDKPPYIKIGDTIAEGGVVCIVEAMKLFNEIESEVSGKIVKVLIEDAQPVQYDQVLFLVDPKG